jgi:hypothetical protein
MSTWLRRIRASRCAGPVWAARCRFTVGALAAVVASTLPAQQRPAAPSEDSAAIWSFTYLKARDGQVDNLERAITLNWFVMDAKAIAAGHMRGYQLLRAVPGDTTFDLVEISMYRDSTQHAQIDSLFRTIYRPQHTTVLVDGKRWNELGSIVRTVTTRAVTGWIIRHGS